MSCSEFDIWNPIPPGSRFCAKVTTTNADFLANVRVANSNGIIATFGSTALLNGPVCTPLGNTGHGVVAEVHVDDEAPVVVLDLMVVDAAGNVVHNSTCQFSQANTTFKVSRALVP
jgi:hypothetical protein